MGIHNIYFCEEIGKISTILVEIKALTALVGRLSLSVSWEIGHERELKTVSFNP